MASYRVRFLKKVCNDTGHEHRACQSVIEVDAESSETAVTAAQKMLSARSEGMEWRFYYDEIEVEALARKAGAPRRSSARVLLAG
jgi:hypothetical protein